MSAAVSPVRMEEVAKIRLVDTVAAVHQGGPERTVTKVTVLLIFGRIININSMETESVRGPVLSSSSVGSTLSNFSKALFHNS